MRRHFDCFTKAENQQARDQMRYLEPMTISDKLALGDQYWNLPVLLRLIERVDRLTGVLPESALAVATPLPELAIRIPVRRESKFYASKSERRAYTLLCRAVLLSAQAAAGHFEDSDASCRQLITEAESAGRFVEGEVNRRVACVAVETADFDWACSLATKAAELLYEEGETELTALALIHLGNALNLKNRPGSGTESYAKALYFAAQTNTERSRTATVAAATNMTRDAFFLSPDVDDVYRWAAAARDKMKHLPYTLAKLKVHWAEALAAYRYVPRYSILQLERIRDRLIRLGKLNDAITCTADIAAVALRLEEESLPEIARRTLVAMEAKLDPASAEVLRVWAERPSDVSALRQLRAGEVPNSGQAIRSG